ncbi:hypothetical protein GLOIN_2v1776801 [Rhizophagus clarus]|uniref:Transposase domain-containing protein n=1 Tax=Rhizophagus clarus TaxID=94130 RepID=A0A8H3L7Q4_9GLOM|nr:hypothetical protein GLOIN_2v1776801 [Rhizophagus clarus]
MAIICCSSNIPAARKLCGYISVLAACHQCYKQANNGNFSGFDDVAEWFKTRDLEEFCEDAVKWHNCKSKDERNHHVSNNLVRWTELLRLPYFNPIRHCVIDPMHNLFLGIARNFVRACSLLVCQIVSTNELNKAHSRLIKIGRLIEKRYGKGLITPNIHLSLHLAECCYDYSPIYSFWCFSFERMNGILVQTNNQRLINGVKLIEPQKTTGSLAAYNDLEFETLLQLKQIFCCELEDTITGSEFYPKKFLNPIKNRVELPKNLYKHLITYYNEVYGEDMNVEFSSMSNLIDKGLQNDSYIVVQPMWKNSDGS